MKAEHVWAALDDARSGPLEEGSVGGGTGMICYGFKGGSGTASRLVEAAGGRWTVGAFVQKEPVDLVRLARRATLGIGRSGTIGRHSSGDIFLAFTTANGAALSESATKVIPVETLPEAEMNPLFEGAIQAIDEAILNALVANRTMFGRDGHRVPALPAQAVLAMLRAAGRI